jgi:uncharacterized lipoprotein
MKRIIVLLTAILLVAACSSSNKTTKCWLTTNSSTSGTKTFTLVASNGNVFCDGEVYRGGVLFIYSL